MFNHYHETEEFIRHRKSLGIKPGLERMNSLLSHLNHPEKCFKSVHVAGTNGKGSTIQVMSNALVANGYRVGVFTSPSLSGLTGHILYNGQKIKHAEWITIMNDIYPTIKQLDRKGDHPTTFEIITAAAFLYFSMYVDIALVETGMGGRYDTTNCLHPTLSIITNVAMDHTAFLGKNMTEIAYHKAGIIKIHTPLILGDVEKDIYPVFQHEATAKNADVYQLHHDFTYCGLTVSSRVQNFLWKYGEETYDVKLLLHGKHQVKNTSLAIMALSHLTSQGITLDWKRNLQAIFHTKIPGRFETLNENPLVIADGAHNPAGAESFIHTVNYMYSAEEKVLIFAAYKDKDIQTMLDDLSVHFQSVALTTFADERAASAAYLYDVVTHSRKCVIPDWKEIINKILSEKRDSKKVYFITGSLAFISIVRSYILEIR